MKSNVEKDVLNKNPLEDKITVKTEVMDRGGALIGIQWGRLLATCSLFFFSRFSKEKLMIKQDALA